MDLTFVMPKGTVLSVIAEFLAGRNPFSHFFLVPLHPKNRKQLCKTSET
jgi:hypothetical protein